MISQIKKFITFNNDKLVINNLDLPKSKPIYVLSIIGKARTGKSTLLNCILSSLVKDTLNENNIFQTSDSDEHCTHGVDACSINYDDKTILVLDVQGIEYHDSSLDTKMLLIIYLISNLIIFNEKNLISNATLQSLLPLTTFISCLELSSFDKPNIIFRIADCDLTLEPMEHLNKTLTARKDQYQNIRETIKELFKNIDCLTTSSLDRTEKKLLKQNKYFGFLENDENKFKLCSNTITSNLLSCDKKFNSKTYIETIKSYSKNINDNKKIDYNKLDINFQIAKNEILEWIKDNVDEKYYLPISVDGTQKQYEDRVIPIKNYFDSILQKFKDRFVNINMTIKDSYYNDIQTKYMDTYNDALTQTKEKAKVNIINNIECVFNNTFTDIYYTPFYLSKCKLTQNVSIKLKDTFINDYIDFINKLKKSKQINIYHNETVNNIIDRLAKESYNKVIDKIDKLKNEIKEFITTVSSSNDKCLELSKNMAWENIYSYIDNFTTDFNKICNDLIDTFENKLLVSTKTNTLVYDFIFNNCKYDTLGMDDCKINIDVKDLTNNSQTIKLYLEHLKSFEKEFINQRNSIARKVLSNYNTKLNKPNYGKYKSFEKEGYNGIKYPTYNLSLLDDYSNKYIFSKLEYIKSEIPDVFNKLYVLDDILSLNFLDEYFVEEYKREKLGQYYLLLVSNKTNDTVKEYIAHKYIDIIFDIIIMDISIDDVCYKL